MRNLITMMFVGVLIIAATSFSNAQIQKKEVRSWEKVGNYWGMLELHVADDGLYRFTYQDIKFQTKKVYKTFYMYDEDDALAYLYNEIMKGFETMPEKPLVFEMPDDKITIHFEKSLGVPNAWVYHKDLSSGIEGKLPNLTVNRVVKWFGQD
ncbi:hypothetical protein [Marivirga sp.]|uniref:hypothetical protein n=1 Tax=Marivirga sp. TaxID=2018662 RepID=UPI003DA71DE0